MAVDLQIAETSGWLHRSNGDDLVLLPMKLDRFIDIAVGEAITVGQQESVFFDERKDPFQSATGHGRQAGINQGNGPILFVMLIVVFDLGTSAQAEGNVAGVPVIISEVFLNDLPLITQAQDEIFVPVMGIDFHDVPEDRAFPDRYHRFGAKFSFFSKSRSQASAKYDNFH